MTTDSAALKRVERRRKQPAWLKNLRHDWLIHILIVFGLLVAFVPIYLMLSISLKNMGQFITQPLGLTLPIEWSNYTIAWNVLKRSILNSLGMTTVTVFLSLLVSALAAYAFSRFSFPRSKLACLNFPSRKLFTSKLEESAFTAFVPTPFRPTENWKTSSLYLPPVLIWLTHSTTLPSGMPRP